MKNLDFTHTITTAVTRQQTIWKGSNKGVICVYKSAWLLNLEIIVSNWSHTYTLLSSCFLVHTTPTCGSSFKSTQLWMAYRHNEANRGRCRINTRSSFETRRSNSTCVHAKLQTWLGLWLGTKFYCLGLLLWNTDVTCTTCLDYFLVVLEAILRPVQLWEAKRNIFIKWLQT